MCVCRIMANIRCLFMLPKKKKTLQLNNIYHLNISPTFFPAVWPKFFAVLNPCMRNHRLSMEPRCNSAILWYNGSILHNDWLIWCEILFLWFSCVSLHERILLVVLTDPLLSLKLVTKIVPWLTAVLFRSRDFLLHPKHRNLCLVNVLTV